jgi:hypothetical protein
MQFFYSFGPKNRQRARSKLVKGMVRHFRRKEAKRGQFFKTQTKAEEEDDREEENEKISRRLKARKSSEHCDRW